MPYRVALTYNEKKEEESFPLDYYSEFDSKKTIDAIADALRQGGNEVVLVEADRDLLAYFREKGVDIVFNIAEGLNGRSREAQVPAILDFLNIPYTGSGVVTLTLALDKAISKKIFRYEGIPTPHFQLFRNRQEELNPSLNFPLIVKPNREGSARGIWASSVVENKARLYEEIERVHLLYNQEVLVEEFIEGRELTVGVLGNGDLRVLPILEIDFSRCGPSGEYFYSWRMKEYQGDASKYLNPTFYCPARLDEELEKRVKDLAVSAHQALECLDFSRIDIRLSRDGSPYVLEVNPLPGLDPQESNLTFMAEVAKISYKELINGILESALERKSKPR